MTRYIFIVASLFIVVLVCDSAAAQSLYERFLPPRTPASTLDSGFTSWQWLNPLPQGRDLHSVQMIDDHTIIAVGGSIIKSTNSGETWSVRFVGNLEAVHFVDHELGFAVGYPNTILKTQDGGETWVSIRNPLDDDWSAFCGVHFRNKFHGMIVGENENILSTTDGGLNWFVSRHGSQMYSPIFSGIASLDSSNWIAIGRSSYGYTGYILRSGDAGSSWTTNTYPLKPFTALSFYDAQTGIIASGGGEVLLTTDGGVSWLEHNLSDDTLSLGLKSVAWLDSTTATVVGLNFNPSSDRVVILQTCDKGSTWVRQECEIFSENLSVSFSGGSNGTIVGDRGGIFHTSNRGVTWRKLSKGTTMDLYGISFATKSTGIAVGSGGTILRTTDGGLSWYDLSFERNVTYRAVSFITPHVGFIVGTGGTILRSTDIGLSWTRITSSDSFSLSNLFFSDINNGTAVGYPAVILRTTDGGSSWISQDHPYSGYYNWINGVYFIDSSTGTVVGDWGKIGQTSDGGHTWVERSSGALHDLHDVIYLNRDTVFVTSYGGEVLKTNDGGLTWTSFPLGDYLLRDICFANNHVGIIISEDQKVFQTTDGGENWRLITNLPATQSLLGSTVSPSADGQGFYVVGSGGTILCAAASPLNSKTWTWVGLLDSSWNDPANWTPVGTPLPGDSVIIPPATHSPIIDSLQQQIVIASLNILSGGKLTITDVLPRFVVLGDVTVHGTLEVLPPAQTTIIVGGNWTIHPGGFDQRYASLARFKPALASDAGFIPYHSTVLFSGSGTMAGNFYNLMFDSASTMQSRGNVMIESQCTAVGDVNLRVVDTVTFTNTEPQALVGPGKFLRGTVRRTLGKGVTESYNFESSQTSLRFNGSGTYPASVTMTVYPDTNPSGFGDQWEVVPSRIDTVSNTISADSITHFTQWAIGTPRPRGTFLKGLHVTASDTIPIIRRVYRITAQGADSAGFVARLSLRYDQSEVPEGVGEDSLVLLRSDFVDGVKDHNSLSSYVPKEYRLEQNYPNPFNPSTTIRFEIPVSGFVTLKVYNVLGQEVVTLVNERKQAGRYEVPFDGSNLPTDVYYYRLQAGDFTSSKALLLIR